ncbi:hypothetical protein D3874_27600 [Oleomonas cavernae]|uniref:Uncharacterized protein n=1 Tax=Oleomonas cavernae TaxID=2320859 RepID=A0A418VTG7_9PROT|nr:hypothetical protein D3874_27600 [Oleomonas cavernae]
MVSSDPRLAALNAHFSLMQDFLDSQARVLGLATGTAPVPAMPQAAAAATATPPAGFDPAFPMLGIVELSPASWCPSAATLSSKTCSCATTRWAMPPARPIRP